MDIKTINNLISSTAVAPAANTQQTAAYSDPAANTQQNGDPKAVVFESSEGKTTDNTNSNDKQPEKKKLESISDKLNTLMVTINTDIRFKLHEKTQEFMVDVVDTKTGRVLKECPPHEFYDMIAKLKEYIGALIDKKI